ADLQSMGIRGHLAFQIDAARAALLVLAGCDAAAQRHDADKPSQRDSHDVAVCAIASRSCFRNAGTVTNGSSGLSLGESVSMGRYPRYPASRIIRTSLTRSVGWLLLLSTPNGLCLICQFTAYGAVLAMST